MRPLWVEFPEDEGSFDVDYEHLIGSALLARPVVTEGANTASVYFPPGVWYDVLDLTTHSGPGSTTVPAPRDKVGLLLTVLGTHLHFNRMAKLDMVFNLFSINL